MRPRTSISELELTGSPNLRRALKREPAKGLSAAKRAELEQQFEDLKSRRAEALADVRKNGMVINQDKSNARGFIYVIRVTNPALRIAQQCERAMASLAKLLTEDDGGGRKSTAQILAEAEEMLGSAN